MNSRFARAERTFTKEDKAMQRNVFARRHLDADLEAQQGLERIHLQTIRNEKMRLQKELERMRGRGQKLLPRRHPGGRGAINGGGNGAPRLAGLRLGREASVNLGSRSLRSQGTGGLWTSSSGDAGLAQPAGAPEARGGGRNTIELPAISSGNGSSPRSPRGYRIGSSSTNTSRGFETSEEFYREQQMLEHRKNLSKKQEELNARMEKFGEDISADQAKQREGSGEGATRSPAGRGGETDSDVDPNSSFPPPGKSANRRLSESMTDSEVKNAKQSIAKRLGGGAERTTGGPSDAAGPSPTEKHLGRTASTASVPGGPAGGAPGKPRRKNTSMSSEASPMDMVFDQNTYAPDGSLRTVHILPDPNDSFQEAKKARYLRWRGPQCDDVELTVNEIFRKDDANVANGTDPVVTS